MNHPVEIEQRSGSRIGRKHMRLALVRSSLIAVFTLGWGLTWSAPADAGASPETEVFTIHLVDDLFTNPCPGGEDMLLTEKLSTSSSIQLRMRKAGCTKRFASLACLVLSA